MNFIKRYLLYTVNSRFMLESILKYYREFIKTFRTFLCFFCNNLTNLCTNTENLITQKWNY